MLVPGRVSHRTYLLVTKEVFTKFNRMLVNASTPQCLQQGHCQCYYTENISLQIACLPAFLPQEWQPCCSGAESRVLSQ